MYTRHEVYQFLGEHASTWLEGNDRAIYRQRIHNPLRVRPVDQSGRAPIRS